MDELEVLLEKEHFGLKSMWLEEAKTKEEKEELRKLLLNSDIQFRSMERVLRRFYREANARQEDFGTPNWEYRNAFEMGYKKALRDLMKVLPKTKGE